jgi:hypothetical protein
MPDPLGTRTRSTERKIKGGYEINLKTGVKTPYGDKIDKGRQYTVSEGHHRSRDGKYREGGPFYTYRCQENTGYSSATLSTKLFGTIPIEYHGPICVGPVPVDTSMPTQMSFRSTDTSDLDASGATAIARCSPTNPVSTLSTGLGEVIKDGLPSIHGAQTWKRRTELIRSAGSEYLNHVFGWVPLLSEISDVRSAVSEHDDLLKQFDRDAGRQVRRGYEFPVEKNEYEIKEEGKYASFIGGSTGNFNDTSSPGTLTTKFRTTRRKWFKGAFTYPPLPSSDSLGAVERYRREADYLFGLTITPDVLWELTPWSWAVDWFTNTGDVIHNVTSMNQYGLMMRYGYIMEETTSTITRSMDRSGLKGHPAPPPPSTTTYVAKVRRPASPFGFGITWEGLSPSQLAITAALGITRVRL